MSTYTMKSERVMPGIPTKILERDSNGQLLAEYTAYYNCKRHTFTLYPRHNPFAANNGKLRKHEISANLVRY